MTYPFGAYICVMDIDVDTGVAKTRRFYALDDCGTRINPLIIEGQVHGGLTEAFAIAMGQEIAYDEIGNVKGASFMDLLPADRGGDAALGDGFHRHAVAASSDRREGSRREPERRRRSGVQQRGERCVRLPRQHAHSNAARRLAGVAGGTEAGGVGDGWARCR